MPVLPINYTTSITVEKTVSEIEALLVKHHATGISKRYDAGRVTGLTFILRTREGEQLFALPVRTEPIYTLLHGRRQRIPYRQEKAIEAADRAQAERVAWRVAKDWLEVNLTLVSVGLAQVEEILFPWMLADDGRTSWEHYLALPAPQE